MKEGALALTLLLFGLPAGSELQAFVDSLFPLNNYPESQPVFGVLFAEGRSLRVFHAPNNECSGLFLCTNARAR
jgi:hypothetical protein